MRQLYDWEGLAQIDAKLMALLDQGGRGMAPFELFAMPSASPDHQREAGHRYAELTCGETLATTQLVTRTTRDTRRPLRIGYLSADFNDLPVTYLLHPVLEQHDRSRVSLSYYSYGPRLNDRMRRAFLGLGDPFQEFSDLSDAEAARRIAKDDVDILVDLNGYTGAARPRIVALRPAPVIVNWLGYPGSLGHPRLADYIIGDRILTPIEHASRYSETLALMPHCYQPNDRPPAAQPTPTREDVGLPAHGFVFCSFNQAYKITPERFALWCRLLEAVPGSLLWLLQTRAEVTANLQNQALRHGITPDRLIFSPPVPLAQHLARLLHADLALDTYPYTSGATASNALCAGIPLVTRIGETYVSRMAASLLHAIGLPELITTSDEAYYERALELALDSAKRAELKQRLSRNRLAEPLFDPARFAQDLERLFFAIWENHARGTKAAILL
jgi:predicted O-linked N-acetylglucosamine transferase (SPINDLY family)